MATTHTRVSTKPRKGAKSCQWFCSPSPCACGRQPNTSQVFTVKPAFLAYKPPHPLAAIWQDPVSYSITLLLWFCKVVTTAFPLIKTLPFPNYDGDRKGMIVKGILVSEVSAPFSANSGNKIGPNPEGMKKLQQASTTKVILSYRVTA